MRRKHFITDGMLVCVRCKQTKPILDFHKNASSGTGYAYFCKPCVREKYDLWAAENQGGVRKHRQSQHLKKKSRIIAFYSEGKNCCACCGEANIVFLTIDHINGGGGAHRRQIGKNFYWWLIKNEFPDGFQVLCYNCNMAKRDGAECPHKR